MPDTDFASESFNKASKAYLKMGDYIKAADELIKSAKMFNKDPINRKLYIRIGDIFFSYQHFEQAIGYYEQALDSKYKGVGAKAQMKIGNTHYTNNDFETALVEYLKIIYLHINEKDYVDDAYLKIGELYLKMGRSEAATDFCSWAGQHACR